MAQTKLNNPYLSKSKYNDISYIGKIYGNFKIVDFVIDKDGRFAFKCMCLCQEVIRSVSVKVTVNITDFKLFDLLVVLYLCVVLYD